MSLTIKDCNVCGTSSVKGLDRQLIAMTMRICPGLLVSITDLNVTLGENVHPYLQSSAKKSLGRAINKVGRKLQINSAWRTIAGQCLLFQQGSKKVCGIGLVGYPGKSNHQSAAAIDIEDHQLWKPTLLENGWTWLGDADRVHFDYKNSVDIRSRSVLAFQSLWNLANEPKLTLDGIMGPLTFDALSNAPTAGFCTKDRELPDRFLSLTNPRQSGQDVLFVQNLLKTLGIEVVVNECFDEQTAAALKVFQSRSALKPDGVVGEKTWRLINNFDIDSSKLISRN